MVCAGRTGLVDTSVVYADGVLVGMVYLIPRWCLMMVCAGRNGLVDTSVVYADGVCW